MKIFKLLALSLAVLASAAGLTAQNNIMSPYSRFGYGQLRDNATSAQQSMGGVGIAMSSGRQINVMNPASYARIDSLTFLFDMGIDMTKLHSSEIDASGNKLTENQFGGGLNYINMQFPIGKRMGMSVGVLPYASVGYSFGNKIENGYTAREGNGSINELYVGLAGRIIDGLNVGFNFSYMFGTTLNNTYVNPSTGSQTLYQDELTVRDWHLDLGLQYTKAIGVDEWTVGLTYSPGKKLHGTVNTFAYDVNQDPGQSNGIFNGETTHPAITTTKTGDHYGLSDSYGLGINYLHDKRLMLEADFIYQPWSKAKFNGAKDQFADRYRGAVGVSFQPANRGGYFKRIQYRAGAYYNRDYIKVRGNHVREMGASMGFGFPVPGFKTMVNLGVGYVHRQATPSALVKEDYFNITLGVNFNEMWFFKSTIQ